MLMQYSVMNKSFRFSLLSTFIFILVIFGISYDKTEASSPEIIGRALEQKIVFNQDASSPIWQFDCRNINGGGAFMHISLKAGDILYYEVYIPSTGNYRPGFGGFDMQRSPTWGFFRTGGADPDKNGIGLFSDLTDAYGVDRWFTREFVITPEQAGIDENIYHIGPASLISEDTIKVLAGRTVTIYYRNIKIIHTDGTESVIYDGSRFANSARWNGDLHNMADVKVTQVEIEKSGADFTPPPPLPTLSPVLTPVDSDKTTTPDDIGNTDTLKFDRDVILKIVLTVIVLAIVVLALIKYKKLKINN